MKTMKNNLTLVAITAMFVMLAVALITRSSACRDISVSLFAAIALWCLVRYKKPVKYVS
jgi:hypothetical protein